MNIIAIVYRKRPLLPPPWNSLLAFAILLEKRIFPVAFQKPIWSRKKRITYFYKTTLAGRKAYLTKDVGVKRDFMAGPFVNYIVEDTINKGGW